MVGIWYASTPKTLPSLVRASAMVSRSDDAEAVFNREVIQRFPIGSPAQDLVEELKRQKFVVVRLMRHEGLALNDEHVWNDAYARAIYNRAIFICNLEYTIEWRTNEIRKLVDISGRIRAICL